MFNVKCIRQLLFASGRPNVATPGFIALKYAQNAVGGAYVTSAQ
jgi:hypothetical protein